MQNPVTLRSRNKPAMAMPIFALRVRPCVAKLTGPVGCAEGAVIFVGVVEKRDP